MRAGDAGDRADLVAAARERGRGVLAWIGQELIDDVQRGVGRALSGARLIRRLIHRLIRRLICRLRRKRLPRDAWPLSDQAGRLARGSLVQDLCRNRRNRHELSVRINLESWRHTGRDSARKSSLNGLPWERGNWTSLRGTKLAGCLSGNLLTARSGGRQCDGRKSSWLVYSTGLQSDRRKSALPRLLRQKRDGRKWGVYR